MTEFRFPQRLWWTALIIAWAVDLLFWNKPVGLSYLIWITLGSIALFALAIGEGHRPPLASYALAVINLALASTLLLRSEPFTCSLAGMLSFAGTGLLAMTLRTGHWLRFRLGDILLSIFSLIAAGVIRAAEMLIRRPNPESPTPTQPGWQGARKQALPVIRGLILAIPVVAVLAGLLASADLIFAERLKDLLEFFDLENLAEYLFRLGYILVLTYAFAGILAQAIFPHPEPSAPDPHKPWATRFLGATESFIILGSVAALFAIFLTIQFQYLFGGQANITAAGFTYSDYARRGFFELVTVAVLSLGLYLFLSAITRRLDARTQRTFTAVSIFLIGLVLVILISALQRLLLYEQAYGFTRLRTYTHIFIPWLALLLTVTIVLEAIRRPGHFGLVLLLVVFSFGLSFPVINIDALIAQQNLNRVRSGQAFEVINPSLAELDAGHLTGLSADAVPVIAQAYNDPSLDQSIHEQLGAVLACQSLELSKPAGWRSYRLPEARARSILSKLDLSAFIINDTYVKLNNVDFPCYAYYGD